MAGVKTKVTDKGVISFQVTPGDGTSNTNIGPASKIAQPTVSANATLTADSAGAYVLSGTAVLTQTMPAASTCPGAMFVFRAGSAHAHLLLSGAAETTTQPFTDGTSVGGSVALENVVGSSLCLRSDGANFLILGNSGTLTFA